MKTISRDIVSALIISQDQQLLMGMKDPSAGGVYSDCWHIPGGGIEEGEDKVAALIREVREEVGIDISNCTIELVDDRGSGISKKEKNGEVVECHMKFYVYQVDLSENYASIKVSLNDDLKSVEWVAIDKLSNYKLTPPSTTLFKRLGWIKS